MSARGFLYGGDSSGGGGGGGSGFNSLFVPGSSHSFAGSRSMVSFEDKRNGSNGSFFRTVDQEDNGDDEYDEYLQHPEKKRRLKADQVQFLEKSFETDNKLEPDRKIQLAKDLGLQPRQIAIWFQNRRARWKNKQLEKDYDVLQESYNELKANYENLLLEKEKLKSQVLDLSDKLILQETEKGTSDSSSTKSPSEALQQEQVADCVNVQDVASDSSSPKCVDRVQSFLERGDSSYLFEQDQSDGSIDEEDNLEKIFVTPLTGYLLPKIENCDYPDHYLGLLPSHDHDHDHDQDRSFGFWSY